MKTIVALRERRNLTALANVDEGKAVKATVSFINGTDYRDAATSLTAARRLDVDVDQQLRRQRATSPNALSCQCARRDCRDGWRRRDAPRRPSAGARREAQLLRSVSSLPNRSGQSSPWHKPSSYEVRIICSSNLQAAIMGTLEPTLASRGADGGFMSNCAHRQSVHGGDCLRERYRLAEPSLASPRGHCSIICIAPSGMTA